MGLQINDLVVESTLSASTLTATTLYVGTNNIGGSSSSFNSLSATTLSGGTIYSGGTDLYSIFLTTSDGNDVTRVQPGSNITTGGTGNLPIINLASSPSVNNFTFSGTATGNALSATTLSGGTLYSGSTNLYSIFSQTDTVTRVQPGTNITTGGTANNPTVNLVSSPSINSLTFSGTATGNVLSATTLSAGTLFSGSTNLYSIFATIPDQNDITRVQPGTNITTGGTANLPTVNLVASPSINNLTISGLTSSSGGATFTNLSGTNIFSGSVNLQTYFTTIQQQLLTEANLSGATFTGQVNTPSLSATTLSGGTIFSGNTNLYQIFAQTGSTLIHKSGTISGSTFAGNPKKATVTFATAFANTNYAITISSDTNRTFTWESKAAGSFVINSNANTAFNAGNVNWTATEYGEK
jgi:hypothetical protein